MRKTVSWGQCYRTKSYLRQGYRYIPMPPPRLHWEINPPLHTWFLSKQLTFPAHHHSVSFAIAIRDGPLIKRSVGCLYQDSWTHRCDIVWVNLTQGQVLILVDALDLYFHRCDIVAMNLTCIQVLILDLRVRFERSSAQALEVDELRERKQNTNLRFYLLD